MGWKVLLIFLVLYWGALSWSSYGVLQYDGPACRDDFLDDCSEEIRKTAPSVSVLARSIYLDEDLEDSPLSVCKVAASVLSSKKCEQEGLVLSFSHLMEEVTISKDESSTDYYLHCSLKVGYECLLKD